MMRVTGKHINALAMGLEHYVLYNRFLQNSCLPLIMLRNSFVQHQIHIRP
jgi:hypothetical protein